MKRLLFVAIFLGLILTFSFIASGETQTHGTLNFSPATVKNGGTFTIALSGGPANTATRLWVNNNDGKGFRDFGNWVKTDGSGAISASRILNCASYLTLEPGQSLPIGDRVLNQNIYLEFVDTGNISATSAHAKDCTGTGNALFPFTLKNVIGRDYFTKSFPTAAEYSAPFKQFVGRWYDSPYTQGAFQSQALGYYWGGMSGGGSIAETSNKIYVGLGSAIAAYNKNTFISRLQSEPLSVFKGTKFKSYYNNSLLPWDVHYVATNPQNGAFLSGSDSKFTTNLLIDDRGYLYLSNYGIIIAHDTGSSIRSVSQILAADDYARASSGSSGVMKFINGGQYPGGGPVAVIKTGGKYYLVTSGSAQIGCNTSACLKPYVTIYDVTDPLNPFQIVVADTERAKDGLMANVQSGETVAVGTHPQYATGADLMEIKLYSATDYIAGLPPNKTFSANLADATGAKYVGLTVDPANGKFYATHYTSNPTIASISVFAPGTGGGADSYTETKYQLSAVSMSFQVASLNYNNGYLTALGQNAGPITEAGYTAKTDIKIWIFKDGQLQELNAKSFANKYYTTQFAATDPQRGSDNILLNPNLTHASVHTLGNKDYLFVGGTFIDDVYEITPTDRDVVLTPPVVEICGNGIDDDKDGLVDEGCGSDGGGTPIGAGGACYVKYKNNLQLRLLCEQIESLKREVCGLSPSISFCKELQ